MAHKVLVNGTAYAVKGGRTLIGGTGYSINRGRTLVNGTGYNIDFTPTINLTIYLYSYYVYGNTVDVYVNDKLVGAVWSDEGGEEYFEDFKVHVGDVVRAESQSATLLSWSRDAFTNISTSATAFVGTMVKSGSIGFDAGE